ncbi:MULTISPECIES: alpha/beta hydrolase [unclassified Pseudomonas]|jgi:alpha-beta hydrolase superfamily lysophospholipase|uniref:alpha/beta hydrolase n=1 Tax=unclassified Pseudomonas TaxID=196821 RepID=UPI000C82CF96|nr:MULTISPECIES: alpha/beta hydrolase [unclassified Pseudomonas]MDX9670571.1 alpha/beta hydrolase [Pseudomonas sp. P8_250]PMQ09968.1 Phospholipase YtpA [Pseudomonas sp. AD21]WPN35428.1 alpha/beta hydrolase [Pseudomonas sp. P8_139]WPN42770.1 alpha/beta hydrolase [Pseudomonas sp. P8_229]
MIHHAFWLDASDRSRLFVNQWLPAAPLKAVILLAHGMAEHSARYERLAEAFCAQGYGVYAPDLRGHGRTAENGTLGHFADDDGWCKVIGDLASLNQHIGQQHPDVPIILLGHSMGSYLAQGYLLHHSASLHGAILSGSNFQPVALYGAARQIARLEKLRQGARGRSALIAWLSFGSFNKKFKPARTPFDWLSRDPVEVDLYANDPLCGFRCTNQLWIDLLGGLQQISKASNLAQIDPGLPLLVIGGECDPVSEGKRLTDLADALRTAGSQNLQLKIYPQARHELFNETNRDEVIADVLTWIDQALSHRRPHRSE